MAEKKTNVMRLLDGQGITYRTFTCDQAAGRSGIEIAALMGYEAARMYKTLVTVGESRKHYVFVIPVARELNLKKAARAADEKNIAMVRSAELLPLTGYIHGGCSPIGMKKTFPIWLDESARAMECILISGGKVGRFVELSTVDLPKAFSFTFAELKDAVQ